MLKISYEILEEVESDGDNWKFWYQFTFTDITIAQRKLLGLPLRRDNPNYIDPEDPAVKLWECVKCGDCCRIYKPDCENLVDGKCKVYDTPEFPEECAIYACVSEETFPILDGETATLKSNSCIDSPTEEHIIKKMEQMKDGFENRLIVSQKETITITGENFTKGFGE